MKELYVTPSELSAITERPLPQILQDIQDGHIDIEKGSTRLSCAYDDDDAPEILIPLSQFFPYSWNDL